MEKGSNDDIKTIILLIKGTVSNCKTKVTSSFPPFNFFIADLSDNLVLDKFLPISFVNLSKIREIKI